MHLGGVEQLYYSPCCKKPTRVLTSVMDTRLRVVSDENARLRLENEKMAKRLRELEGRDETLQMRLENERRLHAKNVANLQRQLEDEQRESKRLQGLYADGNTKRPQRPALVPPGKTAGCSSPLLTRPKTHPLPRHTHSLPADRRQQQQQQQQPAAAASNGPAAAAAAAAASPTTPENFVLRSRPSGSRLPVAVNPSTPLRSHTATPQLPRDPSLTDSTQFSMASSIFSRVSAGTRGSESAAPSPLVGGGSPLLGKTGLSEATAGKTVVFTPEDDACDLVGLGIGADRLSAKDGTASVSSAAPGTATASGSAVSSPRAAKAELDRGQQPRVPPLPTAKSWADVARRDRK